MDEILEMLETVYDYDMPELAEIRYLDEEGDMEEDMDLYPWDQW